MGGLQRFEQRLESAISGVFAKAFRSAVQPVEIAAALQREVDNEAQILSRKRRLVPNTFHIELSATDLDRLSPYDSALATELAEQLQDHADSQGYVFPGPIRIEFEAADDLGTGRFRVLSKAEAKVTERRSRTNPTGRTRAVLDVNGTQHPLSPPGLVVGRGSDTDLQIDDPGVSRRHAQFLITNDTGGVLIEVHDMGSTNGIKVDGTKVPRATLHEGSRVQVGRTSLIVRLLDDPSQEDQVV